MSPQIRAIFRLKWTMFRRSFGKSSTSGLAVILALFTVGALISIGISFLLFYLARLSTKEDSYDSVLLLLDGSILLYCFFFCWGLLLELQRNDVIDFKKMLFLPVSLSSVYLINYLASLLGPLFLFSMLPLAALFCGLYPAMGAGIFPAGIILFLSFFMMLGAWSYYLRGKLAMLMENPKWRRIVFMLVPISFIFIAQMPALVLRLTVRQAAEKTSGNLLTLLNNHLDITNKVFPLLWPAYGLWSVCLESSFLIFALTLGGMWIITLVGLYIGFVSTLRHYMGASSSKPNSPLKSQTKKDVPVTAKRLPFLSEDTSSLVCSFYVSFSRHPHVRMLLIMPICFGLFVLFMQHNSAPDSQLSGRNWIPTACLLWPFINFSFFMFNLFGIDNNSFRILQLLPTARYKYLLAKNIAVAPIVLGLFLFFFAVSLLLIEVSVVGAFLSLILALQLFLLFSAVGNVLSIKFPHRLHRDALRSPTDRIYRISNGFLSMILSLILVLPAFSCLFIYRSKPAIFMEHLPGDWAVLIPAVLLTFITLFIYRKGLHYTGDMLTAQEGRVADILLGELD
ncbi:MAG: hypothetical protein ACOYI9_01455 [Candidatus Hydrogenedentales bacterium]|jgi:hypothetical protein